MQVLRYAAFTGTPDGGNPAGVVLDADGADTSACWRLLLTWASETAFLFPLAGALST